MDKRVATFENRPGDDQLLMPLGIDQAGTSNIVVEKNTGRFEVRPQMISMKAVSIFMVLFLLVISSIGIYLQDKKMIGMSIAAALIVVPAMIGILHYINVMVGRESYLIVHEKSGEIEFPRLEKSWSAKQVVEVIQVTYWTDCSQISVLIREKGATWSLVHAFNESGVSPKLTRGIAQHFGVPAKRLDSGMTMEDARALQLKSRA